MSVQKTPSKLIKGATGDWEMVIGLEVHAQVTSQSKLFSGASTAFGGEPNTHVSLVDAAMPGMLPVINEECVRQAIRTGLGLKAKINLRSVFDRKNYFYPDLPQGYASQGSWIACSSPAAWTCSTRRSSVRSWRWTTGAPSFNAVSCSRVSPSGEERALVIPHATHQGV